MRIFTSSCPIAATAAVLALALAAPVALAQNYAVDVHAELSGLDVKIEPVPTSGLLAINLSNHTDRKVRCDLLYDASPQPLYRSTVWLKPHQKTQSAFRARRKWTSVDVSVHCTADAD